jgi:uncharacterized membrane protein YeaQ/YmgE (transglycosylase-associated protein family)
MSFIAYVILIALTGIVVGALARLALPGRDPMSLGQTMLIGIGGSLAAGLLADVVFPRGYGFPIAVLFATVIVYFVRRSRGGSLSDPGRPPPGR